MLAFLNVDTNTLIQSPGCDAPVTVLEAIRGDGENLQLQLLQMGSPYEAPAVSQFRFVVKRYLSAGGLTLPDYEGVACALATDFVWNATTQRYVGSINYIVSVLNDLLQIGADMEMDAISLVCQVAWRPTNSVSWQRSQEVRFILHNNLWRGTEVVPGGAPTEPGGGPFLLPAVRSINTSVINNNAVANTLQDVTGLSFPVEAGKSYGFRFQIPYSAAATTTGSRWSINGPTATQLNYFSRYTLTATTDTSNYSSAYNSPAAANATSLATGNLAIIEGVVTVSANGNIIARFASEIGGSAIVALPGANVTYWEMNMS